MTDSFPGYVSLSLQSWSSKISNALLQALLTHYFHWQTTAIKLVAFSVYVTSDIFFPFYLSLFCTLGALTMICPGEFIFWSYIVSVLCASCLCVDISLVCGILQ